jgi:hypothetical protein
MVRPSASAMVRLTCCALSCDHHERGQRQREVEHVLAAQKVALSSRLCDQAPGATQSFAPPDTPRALRPFGSSSPGPVDSPVIALHCSTIFAKGSLCELGNPLTEQFPCSDFDVQQPILDACNVFLMVARADTASGVAGCSVGIALRNESTLFIDWALCADDEAQSPPWPSNEGGNRVEWNRTSNCQRTEIGSDGVHVMAGFFYIYSGSSWNRVGSF